MIAQYSPNLAQNYPNSTQYSLNFAQYTPNLALDNTLPAQYNIKIA